jgi:hypothetical protein
MLDRLTLDQLRILVAVEEEGSFSSAARRLGRVQSAVSQSVQALEATLGVALFDRSERTPKLSDAGRALLADARQVSAQRLRLVLHAHASGRDRHRRWQVEATRYRRTPRRGIQLCNPHHASPQGPKRSHRTGK